MINLINLTWFFFAFSILIILVYQDYKNKMLVDSRFNFYMLGCSSFILTISEIWNIGFWKVFLGSLIILTAADFIYFLLKIGKGDIEALKWINLGLFAMNPKFTLIFNLILMIMFAIHSCIIIMGCKIKKQEVKKTPFFIVILLALFLSYLFFIM